jgi:hypothetical protein
VGGDVSVDSEAFLVTDFVNLKIKSVQSYEGAHRGRVYMRVFIGVSACMCINIYIYTVFFKKKLAKGETWLHTRAGATKKSRRDTIWSVIPAPAGGVHLGMNTEALDGKTKNGNEAQ